MREFFCPRCATALEVEVVVAGAPLEDDAAPVMYAGEGSGKRAATGSEPTT
jgi:acetone carboxylase gamma subunit